MEAPEHKGEEVTKSMVITYKCPNCGGAMEFDGQSGKLHCSQCGTEMTVEEMEKLSADSQGDTEGQDTDQSWEENPLGEDCYHRAEADEEEQTVNMQVYHCPNCGAELMTDENTAAVICSFCGSPGLIADRMSGVRRPKAVLPFKITRDEAVKRFLKWTKHGLLTPKEFTSKNTLEKIRIGIIHNTLLKTTLHQGITNFFGHTFCESMTA